MTIHGNFMLGEFRYFVIVMELIHLIEITEFMCKELFIVKLFTHKLF